MLDTLDAAASRAGSDAAPLAGASGGPPTVSSAVAQLRASPEQGLPAALAGLSPEQQDAALAQLSPTELAAASAVLGGRPGFPGPTVDERRDALTGLAAALGPVQLSRLSAALPSDDARAELVAAVGSAAAPAVRAAFAAAQGDPPASAVIAGLGGALGREQYVEAQVRRAGEAAARAPSTVFSGELHRAVPSTRSPTYADHSWSGGGRYNAPGASTLYTSPSLADLRAEVANYNGLAGQSVMRSHFDGPLLDARSLPGVRASALTEPFGLAGAHCSLLGRMTGEDPYTVPRAVGEAARARGLNGVMAPANRGTVNVALFPDGPTGTGGAAGGLGHLATHLTYLDQTDYDPAANPGPVTRNNAVAPNVADAVPNRNSPAANPAAYDVAVTQDAAAHGRAGGARYGAAGAAALSLAQDVREGRFDTEGFVTDVAGGAAAGHADTLLSRAVDTALRPPVAPAGVAAGSLASAETNAAGAAARPVSFTAGVVSGSVISGVISGGVTVWSEADDVAGGRRDAGHATADVVVDTGVGLGAGAAGAAAGAAVGSIVPVAGTAVGAVVGFGVGMGASWLAEHSGATNWLKAEVGGALEAHFEKPLEAAWGRAATGVDAVTDAAHAVEHAAASGYRAASREASATIHAVEHASASASRTVLRDATTVEHVAATAAHVVEARAATALRAAGDALGAAAQGARSATASAVAATTRAAGSAVDGARAAASSAWTTVSGWL